MTSPDRVNPARFLEKLVEDVLGQKIFVVDFAWGFTCLERHCLQAGAWLGENPGPAAELARHGLDQLRAALACLRRFAEEKNLGQLDRGLALARQAAWTLEEALAVARRVGPPDLAEHLNIPDTLQREWQRQWSATVTRHLGESRATLRCRSCGWELTYVAPADVLEFELPFEELSCPFCEAASPATLRLPETG
jgi:hypothetical protein